MSQELTTIDQNRFLSVTPDGEPKPLFRYLTGSPLDIRFSGKTGQFVFDDDQPLVPAKLVIQPLAAWVTHGTFFEDGKPTDRAEVFFITDEKTHKALKPGSLCCLTMYGIAASNFRRAVSQRLFYQDIPLQEALITIEPDRKDYTGDGGQRGQYYVVKVSVEEGDAAVAAELRVVDAVIAPHKTETLTPDAIAAATYYSGTAFVKAAGFSRD